MKIKVVVVVDGIRWLLLLVVVGGVPALNFFSFVGISERINGENIF